MNINFNYNNHEDAQALTAVTEQKISGLEKYIASDQSVVCDVEFSRVAANQNGAVFHAAINLQIDGAMYRAESTEESFEAAIDEARNELDKRLRRDKGKKESMRKRAGRAFKNLLGRAD